MQTVREIIWSNFEKVKELLGFKKRPCAESIADIGEEYGTGPPPSKRLRMNWTTSFVPSQTVPVHTAAPVYPKMSGSQFFDKKSNETEFQFCGKYCQENETVEVSDTDEDEVHYLYEVSKEEPLPTRKPLSPLREFSFTSVGNLPKHSLNRHFTPQVESCNWKKVTHSKTGTRIKKEKLQITTKKLDKSVYSKYFTSKDSTSSYMKMGPEPRIVEECYRLEDKRKYGQLMQQYTTASVPCVHDLYKPLVVGPLLSDHTISLSGRSSSTEVGETGTSSSLRMNGRESYSQMNGAVRRSQLEMSLTKEKSQRIREIPLSGLPLGKGKKEEIVLSPLQSPRDDDVVVVLDDTPMSSTSSPKIIESRSTSLDSDIQITCIIPKRKPVNTMAEMLKKSFVADEHWVKDISARFSRKETEKTRQIEEAVMRVRIAQERRPKVSLEEKLRKQLGICDLEEEKEEEETPEEITLPEITDEMMKKIQNALRPSPPLEVLSEGFKLRITRKDMQTLAGLSWLNDEVINFYMNLIMERGKLNNFPSVYCFTTFFYPKLISGGHEALKRWTRRVDIFSYSLLIIPVHLGMHWCLAVVDFRNKIIKYFDSMGGSNNKCLQAILKYIQAESMDKKKKTYDVKGWTLKNMQDIPQQMNGSDCGMFSCKYAEYISRDADITFTQDDMPYFRRRMVYEILTQKLIFP